MDRGIFEHAPIGVAVTDLEGKFQSCNAAFTAILGYREQELRGIRFEMALRPENLDADLIGVEGKRKEIFNLFIRKDGTPVWLHKRVSLVRDRAGRPVGRLMFAADMTEAKLREEHIRFLMREQSHRLKNLLALVLSIARQSAETGRDRFIESFEARICALAATQDFLLAQDRSRISLEELLRAQLAHFDNGASKRVLLSGPPLFIEQAAAQILALTFHELATNAGKYGALSKGDGEVSISWNIDKSDGAGDVFLISWQERNGPPVLPPLKTGFGLTVIKDMIAESLGGKTGLDFQPQGLTWRLTCPANELISADASHRQETSDLTEANPRKAG